MTVALFVAPIAHAGDFSTESGLEGRWGLGLTIGTSVRARSADPLLIGSGNGGAGTSSAGSFDDGNLNYKKGETFSTVGTLLGELEVRRGGFGLFLRGKAWYDTELKDHGVSHGSIANRYQSGERLNDDRFYDLAKFSGAKFLDAYVFGQAKPTEESDLKVKLGSHVVSWGEALFITSGVAQYGVVDASAARRPGAQVKEVLLPVPQISANLGLGNGLSLEGFYQFQWKPTVLDGCGTYWSGTDITRCGGMQLIGAGAGAAGAALSDQQLYTGVPGVANGRNFQLREAPAITPKDGGQFGLAARYFVPAIETDLAVYFVNYHQRIGNYSISKTPSDSSSQFGGAIPALAREWLSDASAENIKVLGLSAATTLGGASVFGEVSYTKGVPVQINAVDFNIPNGPVAARMAAVPNGGVFHGYDRKNKTQLQFGASQSVGRLLGSESLSLSGEVGFQHWEGIGDPFTSVRYGRSSVFGAAAWNGVACTAVPATFCENKGYVTSNAWGYRAAAQLSYPDVIGVNLRPRLTWSHDVSGYSGDGTFLEDRKVLGLGLRAEYLTKYFIDFSYSRYNRNAKYDTFRDRDYFALSAGLNF